MKIPGKALAEFFFKAEAFVDGKPYEWRCTKCEEVYKSPRGYSNLTQHLPTCRGANYEERFRQHLEDNGITLDSNGKVKTGKITQKTIDAFVNHGSKELRAAMWIEWLAMRNMPLSEIENPITRELAKSHEPFSIKSIRKYIIATAQMAEKAVAAEMAEAGVVTLIMDGWTADGTSTH